MYCVKSFRRPAKWWPDAYLCHESAASYSPLSRRFKCTLNEIDSSIE